jgi:type IV fimbrial biogenesis protein FimT
MNQRGLSLIELMITLAIVGILLNLAMPSFRGLLGHNRQQTMANDLLVAIRAARTEAVLRQQPVIIHPLEGSWSQGWRMIADVSGKGLHDPSNPVLVVRQKGGNVKVLGNSRLAEWVRFSPMGVPSYAGASPGNGSLYICDSVEGRLHARVVLAPSGRVRLDNSPGDTDLCASTNSLHT